MNRQRPFTAAGTPGHKRAEANSADIGSVAFGRYENMHRSNMGVPANL